MLNYGLLDFVIKIKFHKVTITSVTVKSEVVFVKIHNIKIKRII